MITPLETAISEKIGFKIDPEIIRENILAGEFADYGGREPFPFLNENHELRSEEAIEAHSRQPLRSLEEACAQYDRLKAGRAARRLPKRTVRTPEMG